MMSYGNNMMCQVPSDITETSLRGKIMSVIAIVSMSTLFLLETKAYFLTR